MNKLFSYWDSFQSTWFNQKQRDLFPRRSAIVMTFAAGAGLLYFWATRGKRALKAARELERAA